MCTTFVSLCVSECVCVQLLQTLLLDELAGDVADVLAAVAVLSNELPVLAAVKCCAKVDTRELPLLPDATTLAVVLGACLDMNAVEEVAAGAAAPVIVAVVVVVAATFVAADDSDNEDVEDCEPNGDEEAINAAAAEFAPPPYVTADDVEAVKLAAAEAIEDEPACDSDDKAEADEFELVDEDDGDDDALVVAVAVLAVASGGDSGILRACSSNFAFNSSTLLNLNLLP